MEPFLQNNFKNIIVYGSMSTHVVSCAARKIQLLDKKTYVILSEEEALSEAERLGEEIQD